MVILVTYRYDDREIMQSIRIRSGLPVRIRKWYQFSQFWWTSTKVTLADMKWNTWWYELLHTFNITILFISNVGNDLKSSERNVIIRNNLEKKKVQGFQTDVSCWQRGFSHQNGQKRFGANLWGWRGGWKTWRVKPIF